MTYLTPKAETEADILSPREHRTQMIDPSVPVFIGKLTSGYLFQLTEAALTKSYKATQYMKKYNLKPQAIQTRHSTSECIDFMLTKSCLRLSDFLYSACNTNEESNRDGEKTQLFDTATMRKSGTITLEGMGKK